MERFTDAIEAEINELNQQIAEKRKLLEEQRGIVHENAPEAKEVSQREAVLATLKEQSGAPVASGGAQAASSAVSYLDSLDEPVAARVNDLITQAFSKGISAAVKAAQNEHPSVVDAFHDALADRLMGELKARKLI